MVEAWVKAHPLVFHIVEASAKFLLPFAVWTRRWGCEPRGDTTHNRPPAKSPKVINHELERLFLSFCTGREVAAFSWADRKGAFVKPFGQVDERDMIDFRTSGEPKCGVGNACSTGCVSSKKSTSRSVLRSHHVRPGARFWQGVVDQDVDVVVVVAKIVMIRVMGQDGGRKSLRIVRAKWNNTLVVVILRVIFEDVVLECSRQE